jgi:hypothetical protein
MTPGAQQRRLFEHLQRAEFVVVRKPPETGVAALGRGFKD